MSPALVSAEEFTSKKEIVVLPVASENKTLYLFFLESLDFNACGSVMLDRLS